MNTSIVRANVTFGDGVVLEDFCIIGAPPRGAKDGELATRIGDNAVIRSHTVIYAGNVIGNNFQTGNKVNIRESNRIGNNVSVGTLSVIEHHVEIADNVRILLILICLVRILVSLKNLWMFESRLKTKNSQELERCLAVPLRSFLKMSSRLLS